MKIIKIEIALPFFSGNQSSCINFVNFVVESSSSGNISPNLRAISMFETPEKSPKK